METIACASRPSSRVSQAMCEPRPGRHAVRHHFENAAHGVAGPVGFVHHFLHLRFDFGVHAAEQDFLALVQRADFFPRGRGAADGRASMADHVAQDLDAELAEKGLGERAGSDARGGLTRAGALEDIARVVKIVLERAGKVGMARTRPGKRLLFVLGALGVLYRQHFGPVLPVLGCGSGSLRASRWSASGARRRRSRRDRFRSSCGRRGRSPAGGGAVRDPPPQRIQERRRAVPSGWPRDTRRATHQLFRIGACGTGADQRRNFIVAKTEHFQQVGHRN